MSIPNGENFSLENLKQMAFEDLKLRWAHEEEMEAEQKKYEQEQEEKQKDIKMHIHNIKKMNDELIPDLYQRFQSTDESITALKTENVKIQGMISNNKKSLEEKMDIGRKAMIGEFNKFKSQISIKFSNAKTAQDEIQAENDRILTMHGSWIRDLQEYKLQATSQYEELLRDREAYRQSMDGKLIEISSRNNFFDQKLKILKEEIFEVSRITAENVDSLNKFQINFEEFNEFFDSEIKSIKNDVEEIIEKVTSNRLKQKQKNTKIENELLVLIDSDLNNPYRHVKPTELFHLCIEFENAMLEHYHTKETKMVKNTGPQNSSNQIIDLPFNQKIEKINLQLAQLGQKIAFHIATRTNGDILKLFLNKSVQKFNISSKTYEYADGFEIFEKDSPLFNNISQQYLQDFLGQYVEQLKDYDSKGGKDQHYESAPGHLRTRVRTFFNRMLHQVIEKAYHSVPTIIPAELFNQQYPQYNTLSELPDSQKKSSRFNQRQNESMVAMKTFGMSDNLNEYENFAQISMNQRRPKSAQYVPQLAHSVSFTGINFKKEVTTHPMSDPQSNNKPFKLRDETKKARSRTNPLIQSGEFFKEWVSLELSPAASGQSSMAQQLAGDDFSNRENSDSHCHGNTEVQNSEEEIADMQGVIRQRRLMGSASSISIAK